MSTEQEKPVLAACPYCGGKAKPISNYRMSGVCVGCEHSIEFPYPAIQCLCCGGVMMSDAAAWNRRYVCPDKHGKPVYSDSIVRISASRTGYQSDRYSIAWDETYLHWHFHPLDGSYIETVFTNNVSVDEIELIEKSEASND